MNKLDTYKYLKLRKSFGRQPMFCESPPVLIDHIPPNREEQQKYILRNPVHSSTQTCLSLSENEINTKNILVCNKSVNHAEGGWPQEINFDDDEATTRYKRKYEREDEYIDAVLGAYPTLRYFANQNNAIEMYNMYFKEMKPVPPIEKSRIRVINVFVDPENRPISSISWTDENEVSKLAVAYCNKMFPSDGLLNKNVECYVWDIEKSNKPFVYFSPPSACWQIVCQPGRPESIIGGLKDGRICVFDVLSKNEPVSISSQHVAHRDPVSALLSINSPQNVGFLSGSSDGQCMWWDIRNLSIPVNSLIMSVKPPISLANSEGISSLYYDKLYPTRLLCGTDTGLVINVNLKGKTHTEIMSAVFKGHYGPVKAVQRSPCTPKVFLTCGDWTTHIWSDDIRTAPIITGTAHRHQITDVVWVPNRVSSYISACADGKFRYWDLLRNNRKPIYTLPVSKYQLLKLVPNVTGQYIAAGDVKGALYLLSLSTNLIFSGNKDKELMIQYLDREGRREHIVENRVKEIRIMKLKESSNTSIGLSTEVLNKEVLNSAEAEYKKVVSKQLRDIV